MSEIMIDLEMSDDLVDEVTDEMLEIAATGEGGRANTFSVCGTPTGW